MALYYVAHRLFAAHDRALGARAAERLARKAGMNAVFLPFCDNDVWLRADRELLDDGPNGEAVILQDSVDVRHAATVEHAVTHEDWIKRAGLPDLRSGADIWAARADLFPNLQFLPQVEDQLRILAAPPSRMWAGNLVSKFTMAASPGVP